MYQNGEIVRYVVSVTLVDTGMEFQLPSLATSVILTTLKPHMTYSYSVAAETSVGIGPYSSPVTKMTAQDSKRYTWHS